MTIWPMTNARRFETYVRWSLYLFVSFPAISIVLAVLGVIVAGTDSGDATTAVGRMLAIGALAIVCAAGDILVAKWGLDRITKGPAPVPWPFVAMWLFVVVVSTAASVAIAPALAGVIVWSAVAAVVASLTPLLSARRLFAVCGVATIGFVGLGLATGAANGITGTVVIWFFGWSAWSTTWMLRVLRELQQAHEVRADLALAEERLRISRDLHDVFGRTLATISVKSELASELAKRGRNVEAADEMAAVRALAESAGTEVRKVVRGELRTTWTAEVDGARALLDSAGIRCVVSGDAVPSSSADALAMVVREGVTNILRHSEARSVTIATAVDGDETTLTIANDGAVAATGDGAGTGLASMADRIAALGGTLQHRRDGAWFVLDATVPQATEVRP